MITGVCKMEWISVEERLPEKYGHYLVYIQGGDVYNIRLARYSPEKRNGERQKHIHTLRA